MTTQNGRARAADLIREALFQKSQTRGNLLACFGLGVEPGRFTRKQAEAGRERVVKLLREAKVELMICGDEDNWPVFFKAVRKQWEA